MEKACKKCRFLDYLPDHKKKISKMNKKLNKYDVSKSAEDVSKLKDLILHPNTLNEAEIMMKDIESNSEKLEIPREDDNFKVDKNTWRHSAPLSRRSLMYFRSLYC